METVTRIEEENKPPEKPPELPTLSDASSTDDELEGLSTFSIQQAKKDLYEIQGCYKVWIDTKTQKALGIEVGINVSEEFPWKRVRFELLAMNSFFDQIEKGETIQEFFVKYKPTDRVLMGYAPTLAKEGDSLMEKQPFVLYVSELDARTAAEIIRNIEMYERYTMNRKLVKRPQPWVSKGSEAEVDMGIPVKRAEVVSIEVQSIYPMPQTTTKFRMRKVDQVRDGYAELLPGEAKFTNVTQQRVHIGIQSSPSRITLEQQTDPTFPSNAWAQYFYEVKDGELELDETSEEEQDKSKPPSKPGTPVPPKEPKPIPEMSDQVKMLIKMLEFNQIDMYRNDYPQISTAPIQIYTNPYLKEIFCFANISKSNGRYVSAVDWYPNLTGIVVASYSFSTKVSYSSVISKQRVDEVQRSILQPNPILMWSFMDSLNFKLEFESSREVTALSFCPYDENVLIGGTINGQIIIWDLQDRAKHLEETEHLTIAQAANRELISDFLNWTIQYDEGTWVFPAATSALDCSQTEAITDFKWLSRNYYISTNGRIHETFLKAKSRYFATVSIDGTVAYWTLDHDIGKVAKSGAKKHLPAALLSSESAYKKLDKIIKPIFMVAFGEPLTSIICDVANYNYHPETGNTTSTDVKTYPITVTEGEPSKICNNFIVGTFFGRIEHLSFEGNDAGLPVNKETVTTPLHSFAQVHDGPVVALERNPFYPEIFVSVGRHVFAVWKEDFPFTPIMWRVRPKILTAVKWSADRPAVLFLTRSDGSFEAWDLLARDDDACLVEVLGGGIITVLSEHRAAVPRKVISIGDYNSSFRMVALPEGFYKPVPNELEQLRIYAHKEVHRKKLIRKWQQDWRIENAELIEEKKRAEADALRELERLRAEAEEAKKPKETQKPQQPPPVSGAHFDLPEKLDKKFEELNYKRVMHNLMSRKKVDPAKLERETALEKERLRYEERKRNAIQAAVSRISEDIAAVRARLLPVEKPDVQLSDMIAKSVKTIFEASPSYQEVEESAVELLETSSPIPHIDYDDIIFRCRERRIVLNTVLGVPYDRIHFCERERYGGQFKHPWQHGYDELLKPTLPSADNLFTRESAV